MSKRILNFSNEIDLKLKELKQELQMPINKIIIMIINEKLEDLKLLKKDYIEDFKIGDNKNDTAIYFRIKEKEKIFLEEQMKKTGNNSLTSEIKYRLLNSIYKNKYFLPIETRDIKKFNSEINMIGNNINQITTKLNSNKDLNNSDISIIKNSKDELNIKIYETKCEINEILKFANNRD